MSRASRPSLGISIGLALAVWLASLAGLDIWRVYQEAQELRRAAEALQALALGEASGFDPTLAAPLAREARSSAEFIHAHLRLVAPLTNRLGWIPGVGPTIAAAAPLAEYAASLSTAADEVLSTLAPLIAFELPPDTADLPLTERLLLALEAAQPGLAAADAAMQRAVSSRQAFHLADLPLSLQEPLTRLDTFMPMLQQGVRILQELPSLLGSQEDKTYLLIAQNQDELRATGGFISGVGTLVLQRGTIDSLQIGDSYDVDDLSKAYPPPPEPLERYMLAEQWLLRDANWSPDFPSTARTLSALYAYITGTTLDGVVAFDQEALAQVLTVTGPLALPGIPEPIQASNLRLALQQAWAPEPGQGLTLEWWEHRKDFLAEIGQAVIARLQQSADRQTLLALARTTINLLQEKHLLLFMDDPAITEALQVFGLNGTVNPGSSDFLMLVDSNVGFNKADALVRRSYTYQIDLSNPSAPTSSLQLAYEHDAPRGIPCLHEVTYGEGTYADLENRCYWDFVRVYVPVGAIFIDGWLPSVPGEMLMSGIGEAGGWTSQQGEQETTAFSALLILPTGSRISPSLTYSLPPTILTQGAAGELGYELRLAKQAGVSTIPISVRVIPPTNSMIDAAAGWQMQQDGSALWQGDLHKDIILTLQFIPHSSP
jgi:hypothetical protein